MQPTTLSRRRDLDQRLGRERAVRIVLERAVQERLVLLGAGRAEGGEDVILHVHLSTG